MSIFLDSKQDDKEKTTGNNTFFSTQQAPLFKAQNQNDEPHEGSEGHKISEDRKDERVASGKRTDLDHLRGTHRQMPTHRRRKPVMDKEKERKKLGVVVNTLGKIMAYAKSRGNL